VTVRRGGRTIAFAGFSTYPWSASMADDAAVSALIPRAAASADVVVAFFHAGAEGAAATHVPAGPESAFGEFRGDSRHFARVAIDAGADLVLGSGPHVLRGLERYRGRLIAYSLGNLAGYKNFSTTGVSATSALLTVSLGARGRFLSGRIDGVVLDASGTPRRGGAAPSVMRALTRADFGGGGLRFAGPVVRPGQRPSVRTNSRERSRTSPMTARTLARPARRSASP